MNKLDNGLRTPFKIYDAEKYQDRHKAWVKDQLRVFDLLTPKNKLLPFQCVRLNNPFPIYAIELVRVSDNVVINGNLLNFIDPQDIGMYIFAEYDYFVYYGKHDLQEQYGDHNAYNLPQGDYYIRIQDRSMNYIWYSEVFTVGNFTDTENDCYLQFTYCSCSPLDDILYGTNNSSTNQDYKNIIYLDADIGEPKYKIEEKGYEDQNGIFHPTQQKHTKTYRLEAILPEYMVDALSIIPMHEVVWLRLPNGRSTQIKEIKMLDTKWTDNSNVATVTMEFTESIIVKIGCCVTEMDEVPIYDEEIYQGYNTVVNSDWYLSGINADTNSGQQTDEVDLQIGDYVLVFDDDDRRTGRITRFTYPDPQNGRPQQFDETNYVTVGVLNDTEGTCIYCKNDDKMYLRIIQVLPALSYWSDRPVMKAVDLSSWTPYGGEVNLKAIIFPNSVGFFVMISSVGEPDLNLPFYKTALECRTTGLTTSIGIGGDPENDPRFFIQTYCYNRHLGDSEPMP